VSGPLRGGAIRRELADLADGPDEAEVTVKIKEQVVEPQEISSGDVLCQAANRRGKLCTECDELETCLLLSIR
jgi:hypothetical protein